MFKKPKKPRYRIKRSIRNDKDTLLDAAALQDHYSRKIKINNFPKFTMLMKSRLPPMTKVPRPRRMRHTKLSVKNACCKKNSKVILDRLNYKDIITKKLEKAEKYEDNRRDQRLKKFMKGLSLAQKRGLVTKPILPLNSEQWESVVNVAKRRLENETVCPICLDKFKVETQVVLSCSHVFHKACLASFEKHTEQKRCPICRREHYEKLTFYEPSKLFIKNSATKIQALFKGHLERVKFFKFLVKNKYTPDTKGLKTRLSIFKLGRMNFKMQNNINKKNRLYKEMFGEKIEKVKFIHSELMKSYEKNVEEILRKRNERLRVIVEDMLEQKAMREYEEKVVEKNVQWEKCLNKVRERSDRLCSICLGELYNYKPLYITSCSHIYHAACLSSFEMMSDIIKCPICRAPYKKMALMSNEKEEIKIG